MASIRGAQQARPGLIAVMGDEDTVTGFLLAGVGQRDKDDGSANFLVVSPEETPYQTIVDHFKEFTNPRRHISIILITQTVADIIRQHIDGYNQTIPTILEIPSKDKPYDKSKDPLMQKVIKALGGGKE